MNIKRISTLLRTSEISNDNVIIPTYFHNILNIRSRV